MTSEMVGVRIGGYDVTTGMCYNGWTYWYALHFVGHARVTSQWVGVTTWRPEGGGGGVTSLITG